MLLQECFISFSASVWHAIQNSLSASSPEDAGDDTVERGSERVCRYRLRSCSQVVRKLSCAAEYQSDCYARRAHSGLRSLRIRKVDAHPLRQSVGGASKRFDRCRRNRTDTRCEAYRRGSAGSWDGFPEFQSLPAFDRARELHVGSSM